MEVCDFPAGDTGEAFKVSKAENSLSEKGIGTCRFPKYIISNNYYYKENI